MKGKSHIFIPDTQITPDVKLDHLVWANNYVREHRPDIVILAGDWWDMKSISEYLTAMEAEGQDYAKDIESGMDALSMFMRKMPKTTKFYFLEGNHENRISRYVDKYPIQRGSMSIDDCNVEAFGIRRVRFLKPICLDSIYYSHYFYTKGSGRPHANARLLLQREHHSCTMGHVQTLDTHVEKKTNEQYIRSLMAGAFYLHDEDYKGPQGNNHWRGIIHKKNVKNGMYDLNEISIHTLKRDWA